MIQIIDSPKYADQKKKKQQVNRFVIFEDLFFYFILHKHKKLSLKHFIACYLTSKSFFALNDNEQGVNKREIR